VWTFFLWLVRKQSMGCEWSAASNLNLMLYYRSLCITSDYQSRALLVMSLMSSRARYWSSEHCCGSGTLSHQCFQLSFEVVNLKYVCWFVALLTRLSYLVQKQNWEYLKCSITRSTRLSICYWRTCIHERWKFGMIFCSVVIFWWHCQQCYRTLVVYWLTLCKIFFQLLGFISITY